MKVWTTMLLLTGLAAGFLLSARTEPHSSHVEQISAPATYTQLEWQLHAVHARVAWQIAKTQGRGVIIASIDTGVSPDAQDVAPAIVGGINTLDPLHPGNFADDHGHGTLTSSEMVGRGHPILGIAPQASLFVSKVLDSTGTGSDTSVVAGIYQAIDKGAAVVNMSLGGHGDAYAGEKEAISYGCARGVVFAVAAGNDSINDSATIPASINSPCLISVDSTDQSGLLSAFSNYGENPRTISAPGGLILGETTYGGVTTMSGTSCAAPLVSGALALLIGMGASGPDAVNILLASASRPPGQKTRHFTSHYGWGELNVAAAVRMEAGL